MYGGAGGGGEPAAVPWDDDDLIRPVSGERPAPVDPFADDPLEGAPAPAIERALATPFDDPPPSAVLADRGASAPVRTIADPFAQDPIAGAPPAAPAAVADPFAQDPIAGAPPAAPAAVADPFAQDPIAGAPPAAPAAVADPFAQDPGGPGSPEPPRPSAKFVAGGRPAAEAEGERRPASAAASKEDGQAAEVGQVAAAPRAGRGERPTAKRPAAAKGPRPDAPPDEPGPARGEDVGGSPAREVARPPADAKGDGARGDGAKGDGAKGAGTKGDGAKRPRVVLPKPLPRRDTPSESESESESEAPPVAPRRSKGALAVGVAAGVLLLGVVPAGVWLALRGQEAEQARRTFLATWEGLEPALALERAGALPPEVLQDPRIREVVSGLEATVRRGQQRARAAGLLARAEAEADLARRAALVDEAVVTDDAWADAYLVRARLRLARAGAAAPDGALGGEALEALVRSVLLDLNLACERDDRSAAAFLARGRWRLDGWGPDRVEAATADFARAIELDPLGALGAAATGAQRLARGDPEGALRAFELALERDPALPTAWAGRSEALLARGEPQGALRSAEGALERDPAQALAHVLRAEARYAGRRDRPGALADVARALALDPTSTRALALRADARLDRDDDGAVRAAPADGAAARRDAEEVLRRAPASPRAHLVLALLELEAGRRREAEEHASSAVAGDPALVEARLLRARLRLAAGRPGPALEDVAAVLARAPGRADALLLEAEALLRAERYDEARGKADQILLARRSGEALLVRGVSHLRGPRRYPDRARQDLDEALRADPELADAYFARAEALHEQGRFREALADLEEAARRVARARWFGKADVLLLRGHCHYEARAWKAALDAYGAFLEERPPRDKTGLAATRMEECRGRLAGGAADY